MPSFEITDKGEGEWFDISDRRCVCGKLYNVKINDKGVGQIFLSVKIGENRRTTIQVYNTEGTSIFHNQLSTKSLTLREYQRGTCYNLLGVAYINENRIHRRMVEDMDEVPAAIRTSFELDKYKNVNPNHEKFSEKIITKLKTNDIEKMVKLYFYTRIEPIREYLLK